MLVFSPTPLVVVRLPSISRHIQGQNLLLWFPYMHSDSLARGDIQALTIRLVLKARVSKLQSVAKDLF
jgi:hypothetical protein